MKKIIKIIKNIIKTLNTCIIEPFKTLLEYVITIFYGENFWYEFLDYLNFVRVFYETLWYMIKKEILNILEDLFLEYTWKIKRSDNFILKILKKYLSKYDWFNNNIIRF